MGLLLSPDHTATLTDPLTWTDNPFVTRDTRRDIKRRQPFVSFCWMCGALLIVAPWAVAGLWTLQSVMGGVPFMLGGGHGGGDVGTVLFFFIAGVHVWFILGAAQRHTTRQFTDESNQNTLSSLLMLPTSPFQVLIQSMIYPWLVAMRMAVALLPLYVLCVAIDGPSWLDLAMLYVVFAMAALSVPFWNRPALNENVSILATPKQNRPGVRQTTVGQEATAARSATVSGAVAMRLAIIPFALMWLLAASTGGLSNANELLQQYLPNSIVSLLPPVVISWPLLVARLLVTPLDWFGLPIIPLPFVLALFLVDRYTRLVRSSELLSVGAYRDLPLQTTYLPRLRLEAWYRGVFAVVVTGYLWKLLVAQGALAWLAPPSLGRAPGLPGFALLVFFAAGLWALGRGAALGHWLHTPLIRGERHILCRSSVPDGVRYLGAPFAYALAFLLVCCLLARANPFPALLHSVAGSTGAMLLQVSLVGMSGAVFSFGVGRLLGVRGASLRMVFGYLIGFTVIYCESWPIRNDLNTIPTLAPILAHVPALRKLEIFSPVLGMAQAAASRTGQIQHLFPDPPQWSVWVLTSLAAGGALWLLAHLLDRRHAAAREQSVTLVYNPTIVGREVFSDPVQTKRDRIGLSDTPFVGAAIAWIQRICDNAIVTRELRSRLRGKWDRTTLLAALGVMFVLSAIWFTPQIASWPTVFGLWCAYPLRNAVHTPLAYTVGGIIGGWYIILYVVALANAFVTTGAFFAETQKSTLGFTLATPMSTRAIVLGKAAGLLGPSLGVMAALACWTLLLSIVFLPVLGLSALYSWIYAIVNALTFYLMINAITFAISAMFPKLSMSGAASIWVLIVWIGSVPAFMLFGLVYYALSRLGLSEFAYWLIVIGAAWLMIMLAFTVAESSIHSMRRRDLTFATSKRNN